MRSAVVNEEFTIKKKKHRFFTLVKYFKPYIPLLMASALLALLSNAAILIRPIILKYIIDDCLLTQNHDIVKIRLMGILFFAIIILGALFVYFQTYILTYIGQKIMFSIRNQLFRHVEHMAVSFFDRNSTGRILTRITNDVEALNEIFSGVLINILKDTLMIIGIISMMFALNVKLALVSIGTVPLIMLVTYLYRIAARKNFIKVKGMISKINGFLAENIAGMRLVQIFHREKEKLNELKELDREYFKYSLREVILNSLCRPVVEIINTLATAILIWYCISGILEGGLEIGVLYAFITYIKQFFEPISELSEKYTSIQSALISSERIFEILDTVDIQEDMESGVPIRNLKGEIEFKNVWFAYNGEDWVLKDVSFKINPGETVAFVGPTGSGKSTIINLLIRFYKIQKGEILLDGININDYRLKDLRRHIAIVLQDVFVFSGDIKSNIRLNDVSITDEEVKFAAEHVYLDKFIESLPNKYNEEVKERGCTLSAGQRQLLSFARAITFKPSILVLDEATSNIDTETEILLQRAIKQISRERTSIIIAHRLSTIKDADKIIVVHKGRIREMGTHKELLSKNGIYSRLYSAQGAVSQR